jgi:hypothetical protein
MNKRIVYLQDNGIAAIISPSPEAIALYGIEAIARKDVPAPKIVYDVPTGRFEVDEDTGENYEVMGPRLHKYAYKIIDASEIPTDRSNRAAWTVDEADLTDGFGGESNEFD